MAFKYGIVQQNLVASGNTQDFVLPSLFSGDVKGAVLFMSFSGSGGVPDSNPGGAISCGFLASDGQLCLSTFSRDAQTTSICRNRFHNARCLYGDAPSLGARSVEATGSILSAGIRLNFGGLGIRYSARVMAIILGGDCELSVVDDVQDASPVQPTFTGVDLTNIDRAAVLVLTTRNKSNLGTQLADATFALGAVVNDGSSTQACISANQDHDNVAGGDTASYFNTGVVGLETKSDLTSVDWTITASNWSATSLDLTYSSAPDDEIIGLMAIHLTGEDRLGLKTFATPTTGTPTTDYTGLGFQCTHLIGCGSDHSGAGGQTLDAGAAVSLFAWDDDGEVGSVNFSTAQGGTTDTNSLASEDISIVDAAGNRDDQGTKAATQSSDGFTIDWSSVDAKARNCWALAFGAAPSSGGTGALLKGIAKVGTTDGIQGYWP